MDLIDGLRVFVATAQTGSFTGAAERLGMSNRLTSKYLAELENRLGVRLLQRTTRRVGVTPAGTELLARAPALLDELDTLIADVSEDSRGFSGVLRISAPVTLGEIYVKDMLARFADLHPGLTIDLRLNDAHVDLASDGIDLAFRVGASGVSALKVRRLGEVESLLVAAPSYLRAHGAPQSPSDLSDHALIVDTNRRAPLRWDLSKGGETRVHHVSSRFLVNSAQVTRDLAVQGQGIAYCPRFVLGDDLEAGRLVRVLTDHTGERYALSVVYLEGRALPRKLRALIDFALRDVRSSRIGLV